MELEKIKLTDLNEAGYNPRQISDNEMIKLQNSINTFGVVDPIIINLKNNRIIGGHQRYNALLNENIGNNKFFEELHLLRLGDIGWVFPDTDLHIESSEHEKALNIALNKISGEWDNLKLEMLLDEVNLSDLDLTITGFDEIDLKELDVDSLDFINNDNIYDEEDNEITDDYFEYEEDTIETNIKKGDLFQLGTHRLLCGDSTNQEDIEILMDGVCADLVFTDPPYGMGKESKGIMNDNLNFKSLLKFNKKWINLTLQNLKKNGSWYCWGQDEPLMDIYSIILKPLQDTREITFRNLITWDKGSTQGQLSSKFLKYPIADEKCLFIVKGQGTLDGGGRFNKAEDFPQIFSKFRDYFLTELEKTGKSVIDIINYSGKAVFSHYFAKSEWEFPTSKNYVIMQQFGKKYGAFTRKYSELYNEYKKVCEENLHYFNNTHDNMNNVWHFNRTTQKVKHIDAGGHETPKPIDLCVRAIKSSSRKKEVVLDVFGGSGSTLIACEQTKRKCYMLEINPIYCQVIIERWEQYTGNKAKKIN